MSHRLSSSQWFSHTHLASLATHYPTGFSLSDGVVTAATSASPAGYWTLVIGGEALCLEKVAAVQQALADKVSFYRICVHPLNFGPQPFSVRVEIGAPQTPLAETLETLAVRLQLELNVLETLPTLARPGLLVMDMDSTVIAIECIDEIAKLAGAGDKVSKVTELAMQGKLDFAQSLTERVACLTGADQGILQQVRDALPLMPGITQLVRVLKQHDWKLAIASGGFTFFADYLAERLGLDEAVSNQLGIDNNVLTGEVNGRIVDARVKAETLTSLAQKWQIDASQTIALGDGANDLVMMSAAGLGVAYHAKPVVRQQADAAIRFGGLDSLLTLLD